MNRRLRILLAGVGVFLIVAIAAGGLAAYQSQIAGKAEQFARSRELAASAIAARDTDPTLSKLLALEAASIADPPVESIASLHRAWDSDRIIYRYSVPADHEASSVDVDLDPSGRYIAVAAVGETRAFVGGSSYLEVVDREQSRTLWSFAPRTEGLRLSRPLFTPDGSRVIFGAYFSDRPAPGASTDEAGIYVFDAVTGVQQKHVPIGDCGALVDAVSDRTAVAFTSTGEVCVRLSGINTRRDIVLESVDLVSGERTTLTPTAAGNDENAVSSDGSTVAFQAFVDPDPDSPPSVVIKHLDTGATSTVGLEFAAIHDITADGKVVLVDSAEQLNLWDVATGKVVGGFAPDPNTHAAYAQFSPDGRTVFSTGGDARIHVWDIDSGHELLSYPGADFRPAPSAGGLVLQSLPETAGAVLMDTSLRGEVGAVDVNVVAGSGLVDGGCDPGFPSSVIGAAGSSLALESLCQSEGDSPQTVTTTVLDRTSLRQISTLTNGRGGPVLSPDGTRIARRIATVVDEAPHDGLVEIDDVASGALVVKLQGLCDYDTGDPRELSLRQARQDHANPGCNVFPATPFALHNWQAHQMRWSPDGSMLVMVDLVDGYLGVWDTTDGHLIEASLAANDRTQFAYDAAFTADSQRLVVSYTAHTGGDGRGRSNGLASISTSDWRIEKTRDLPVDAEQFVIAGTASDGSTLIGVSGVLGLGNTGLYWFDPVTLADVRPPRPRLHSTEMDAVALRPDGAAIATGASDGSIRVWDSQGRLTNELDFPGQPIRGMAFLTPNHLGVALDDGSLRIVTLDANELLDISRKSLTRSFTQDECDRYGLSPCPTLEQMKSPPGDN